MTKLTHGQIVKMVVLYKQFREIFFFEKIQYEKIKTKMNQYLKATKEITLLFSAKYFDTPSMQENRKVVNIISDIPVLV